MARGAAQNAAQHIAAAFVGRCDAVGDHEVERAAVVGDDAHGEVVFLARTVAAAGLLLDEADQAAEEICVVVRADLLDHGGDALEAHASVDVLGLQLDQRAVGLAIVRMSRFRARWARSP
jgi:hypothetical protein